MRYFFAIILIGLSCGFSPASAQQSKAMEKEIILPAPSVKGKISVEQAIAQRRSQRRYSPQKLSLAQIGQLLWSAQGITEEKKGLRAAPSAGALYPMEIYLLTQDGLFRYLPQGHKLEQCSEADLREGLSTAAFSQDFVAQAPVDIVIAAAYERVAWRYGQRAVRYSDIEAGHIAQNIHLQAVALGLASVPVGAFDDQAIKELLKLPDNQEPLYVIPVGYIK